MNTSPLVDSFTPDGGGPRLTSLRWVPRGPARASVVLLHGLGEHAARYDSTARLFTAAGFSVLAMDYEGFGRSEGRRGDVRYESTARAVDHLISHERARTSGAPVVLYGHSLGGLYAFLYAADRPGADVAAVVATGPAFDSELRNQRLKVAVVRSLGRVFATLTVPNGLRFERVNRDPAVVAERYADPLVHGRATARFAIDVLAQMDRVASAATRVSAPLLVVHGDADLINPISASRRVVDLVPSATLRTCPGMYHGVEDEPEGPVILADVVAWIDGILDGERSPG
ncbi:MULTISPECIES: alpha/beta hydrolase [unclassified Nocardia]|uniref:alpha/beta hydrolase n=1 Tax=unclassified Nocardia TaxID=2637762 RepID=UPI0033A6B459